MHTGDVYIQIHEDFLINKEPLGKINNPHFSQDAREIAINLAIRGNTREDGNGYITTLRTNKSTFGKLPKKNVKAPKAQPTMTVEELVMTMNTFIYTDSDGDKFYPEIYGYTPYVKVADADINNTIPTELPNSSFDVTYDDTDPENPIEIPARVKTWNEYFLNYTKDGVQGNYTATLVDGFWYYNVMAPLKGKDFLTGTDLMLIHNSADAELVDEIP